MIGPWAEYRSTPLEVPNANKPTGTVIAGRMKQVIAANGLRGEQIVSNAVDRMTTPTKGSKMAMIAKRMSEAI
jgi:hypothetical protein